MAVGGQDPAEAEEDLEGGAEEEEEDTVLVNYTLQGSLREEPAQVQSVFSVFKPAGCDFIPNVSPKGLGIMMTATPMEP